MTVTFESYIARFYLTRCGRSAKHYGSARSFLSDDFTPFPQIICKNGLKLSIQANQYCYATPRAYRPPNLWTHYEVKVYEGNGSTYGLFDGYSDGDTIYGYVPAAVIQEVIDRNGGIDHDATFK